MSAGIRAGTNNDAYLQVNGVDVLKIAADGSVSVVGGVLGTNGIKFPAAAVLSADKNTLDDYEEGTWTPTLAGVVLTVNQAQYIKVGSLVWIQAYLTFPVTTGNNNNLQLAGLPFNTDVSCPLSIGYMTWPTSAMTSIMAVGPNVNCYNGAGWATINSASSGQLYFGGCYRTPL